MTMITAIKKGNFYALLCDTCLTRNKGFKKADYYYGNSKLYTTGCAFYTYCGSTIVASKIIDCLSKSTSTNIEVINEHVTRVRNKWTTRMFDWLYGPTSIFSVIICIEQKKPEVITYPILITSEKNKPLFITLQDVVYISIPAGVKPEWLEITHKMYQDKLFCDDEVNNSFSLFKHCIIQGAAGIYKGVNSKIKNVSSDYYYTFIYNDNNTINYEIGYIQNNDRNTNKLSYNYDINNIPYSGLITRDIILHNQTLNHQRR